MRSASLQWLPERGVGYYPVTQSVYDGAYWSRYRKLDDSPSGTLLTALRCNLVDQYDCGVLVDVGIGGGRFVTEANCMGFDVNPRAADWLKSHDRWLNPYTQTFDSASFWDSLEHIADPSPLLSRIKRYAFMSIPLFDDEAHVLRSKHFRKDEHFWYFTIEGLKAFMAQHGFKMMAHNDMECAAGREDIGTFVFERAV